MRGRPGAPTAHACSARRVPASWARRPDGNEPQLVVGVRVGCFTKSTPACRAPMQSTPATPAAAAQHGARAARRGRHDDHTLTPLSPSRTTTASCWPSATGSGRHVDGRSARRWSPFLAGCEIPRHDGTHPVGPTAGRTSSFHRRTRPPAQGPFEVDGLEVAGLEVDAEGTEPAAGALSRGSRDRPSGNQRGRPPSRAWTESRAPRRSPCPGGRWPWLPTPRDRAATETRAAGRRMTSRASCWSPRSAGWPGSAARAPGRRRNRPRR